MKDVADAMARLNELGRPDLAEPIHFLMGERDGLMKALASAKTVMESKDKAYSLIQQRWDAMAAKAATVDSERECNEKLTAEVDTLSARVAELEARIEQADRLPLPVDFEGKPEDDTLDRMLVGRATEGDQMVIYNYVCWLEGRYSAARRMLGDRQAVTTTNAENIHRMAECAAIMAVCGYFSRMRGPIGHLVRNALLGSEDFVRGEAYELDDCEIAVPLYAGSAPVPAAQAVDVDAICNAYESGVGHRGRPTANVNPYREGTPEHEAYAIGAKGEAAQAEAKVTDRCQHGIRYPHPCRECEEAVPGSISVCEACLGHGCKECDGGFVMLAAKAKGGS